MKLKTLAWMLWATFPVLAGAYWFGPADEAKKAERADDSFAAAIAAEEARDFKAMEDALAAARRNLPPGDKAAEAKIAFAEARLTIENGQMWAGVERLEALLKDADDDAFARTLRAELSESLFHAAWLMRLEGGTPDEWRPVALEARQHSRLLAESEARSDQKAAHERNVEAIIRLENMDLSELLATPLPKNCSCNCKGLCKNKRKRSSNCKNGKCESDGREKINQGAGATRFKGSGT